MRTRSVLFLVFATAVIASAELYLILSTTSPKGSSSQVLWAFFISFFVTLTCWLSLFWYIMKRFIIYRQTTLPVLPAIRQAGLLSVIIVLSFFFNSLGLFTLWDILPLLISAILIEFFFQADKTTNEIT